jgi:uncharacterized protein YigE (DUF2233 family)
MRKRITGLLFILFISTLLIQFVWKSSNDDEFVSYVANPKAQMITMFLKNKDGVNFGSIQNMKTWLSENGEQLIFAMNGGMYKKDKSPQGLYVYRGNTLSPLDTGVGTGNFYLKPNGIFYLDKKNNAFICKTEDFKDDNIKYATQSGPMLVIDGEIHPAFKKGSANLNIRNGVGILPDGKILFAMSKKEINLYDFAEFFKNKGCKNALYLDGFVSRAYCPSQDWMQTDGDFGVIITVTRKIK